MSTSTVRGWPPSIYKQRQAVESESTILTPSWTTPLRVFSAVKSFVQSWTWSTKVAPPWWLQTQENYTLTAQAFYRRTSADSIHTLGWRAGLGRTIVVTTSNITHTTFNIAAMVATVACQTVQFVRARTMYWLKFCAQLMHKSEYLVATDREGEAHHCSAVTNNQTLQ